MDHQGASYIGESCLLSREASGRSRRMRGTGTAAAYKRPPLSHSGRLVETKPTLTSRSATVLAKEWQSIEGDFGLSATCTALGNVAFDVALHGVQSQPKNGRSLLVLTTN